MPLADWDVFKTAAANVGIQAASPILGTGSLQTELFSSHSVNIQRNIGFNRGFLKGRIRSLLRIDSFTSTHKAMLFCMSEVEQIRIVGSDFYGFSIDVESGTDNLELFFQGNGVQVGFTTSFGTASQTIGVGNVIPMELEWNLDVPGIGGIALTARTGNVNDTDYTNLTDRIAFTDFSPLLTSFAEGIACATGGSDAMDAKWEATEIFSGV